MIYYAIARHAPRLATLYDEDPIVEKVLNKLATGAALWAKSTRADVAHAGVDWYGKNGNAFVTDLTRRGDAPLYQNALATHQELRQRFYAENPAAIDAALALAQWTLRFVARDERRIPLEHLEIRPFWSFSGHVTTTMRDLLEDEWRTNPSATVTELREVACPQCENHPVARTACFACETTGRVTPGKAKRLRFLAA